MANSKENKIRIEFNIEPAARKSKPKSSFRQHIYVLADPNFPADVCYVGRTNNPSTRRSMHATTFADYSARGAWLVHLNAASIRPSMMIVEEAEFKDTQQAEKWAAAQELIWIEHYSTAGADLLNAPHFWRRDDRNGVPAGIRNAWFRMLQVVSRTLFPSTRWEFEQVANRFAMAEGITELVSEFPALHVAPLEYLSPARPISDNEAHRLGSHIEELKSRITNVAEPWVKQHLHTQLRRLLEISENVAAGSVSEVNAVLNDIDLTLTTNKL